MQHLPPNNSSRLQAIRDWHVNADPERAAAGAAARFEREAIAVPPELAAPDDAPVSQARVHADAGDMYRSLVMAGPAGIALRDIHPDMGKQRRAAALRLLRGSGLVTETKPAGLIVLSVP